MSRLKYFATTKKVTLDKKEEAMFIFDEIQANEYHVACAGSLLGVALSRPSSFPVGSVDFLIQWDNDVFTVEVRAKGRGNK
jgi:uncharacterized protein